MKKLLLIALTLLPLPAMAHVGDHNMLDWKAGFLHPLTGLDHLLALLATGIWLAQSETRGKWGFIAVFTGILALAIGVGTQFIHTTFEAGIVATLVVLGALMACAVRGPLALRAVVLGATAAVHGFIHGTELPSDGDVISFALALILSSALVVSVAMIVGSRSQKFARGFVSRVAGAALILFGLGMVI